MCRRGGFSDGRTPHCLDRRRVFSVRRVRPGPSPAPRGAAAAKGRKARRRRRARVYKRAAAASGAFCGKGGARERGDGGFFAADASARSKKDVGAKRTLHRRGGFSDGRTPHCLDRRRVFFGAACTPPPHPSRRKVRQPQKVGSDSEPL